MPKVIGKAMKLAKLILMPSAIVAAKSHRTPTTSEPMTNAVVRLAPEDQDHHRDDAEERREARHRPVAHDRAEDVGGERQGRRRPGPDLPSAPTGVAATDAKRRDEGDEGLPLPQGVVRARIDEHRRARTSRLSRAARR